MANFFDYHASEVIKLKLTDFEGPLDLLYTLIKESKLDIATCRLSEVTGQYLAYMDQIGTVDMDVASDFLVMAATLLDIKAKSLLPQLDAEEEDFNDLGYDPEEELRRQLLLFQMFKEEADELRKSEVLNQFYPQPQYTEDDAEIVVKSFDIGKLVDAYGKILLRISQRDKELSTKKIRKDRYTVAEKIALISRVVMDRKKVNFCDLFEEDASRSEVIATFQALLELMKKQFVKATQETAEADIYIELSEEQEGKEYDLAELTKTEDKYDEE